MKRTSRLAGFLGGDYVVSVLKNTQTLLAILSRMHLLCGIQSLLIFAQPSHVSRALL